MNTDKTVAYADTILGFLKLSGEYRTLNEITDALNTGYGLYVLMILNKLVQSGYVSRESTDGGGYALNENIPCATIQSLKDVFEVNEKPKSVSFVFEDAKRSEEGVSLRIG